MREIKFKFIYKKGLKKFRISKPYDINKLLNTSEFDIYNELIDCECQPIGETNAVECNCDYQLKGYKYHGTIQYTGLKDKNGVEIYEGDIVQSVIDGGDYGYRNSEVVFNNGCFCFKHKLQITWPIFDFNSDDYKVIGNIYDDPELLEK